ncbi:Tn3 family transposase [Klebsiella pneumoniae]|uniref:Tn3 family transposase n=1 Tax=Klebsiella pneumoniae TaxID=573 RepID=UPI00396F358C
MHAGLNKGEARAGAGPCSSTALGNRDRSFKQRYRASGLNPVTAAIVLWNTVYRSRPNALRGHGQAVDDGLLQYLSLGWEHINLTGDYLGAAAPRSARASSGRHVCNRLSVLYLMRWSLLLPGIMLRTGFHSEYHGKHCAHWYRSG